MQKRWKSFHSTYIIAAVSTRVRNGSNSSPRAAGTMTTMTDAHRLYFHASLVALALSDLRRCYAASSSTSAASYETSFHLTSGSSIPLLGSGIGNLPHEQITQAIHNQLDAGVRLIDTARASNNEHLLAAAISTYDSSNGALRGGGHPELDPIHVVTKVWYTHLGYHRTKISVEESLANLRLSSQRQVYVHMLLHWPRCNDNIEWMNCEEEERNLPQHVKEAGPPPHLHESAFLESWKALEDIYEQHQLTFLSQKGGREADSPGPFITSIGVSNFELDDMKRLLRIAKVPPHIYQGNSWLVFHDPHLMNYLHENGIFFQAYAVMTGILHRGNASSNSFNILSGISQELRSPIIHDAVGKENFTITEATVMLAYFIHAKIGVIPRAASLIHQRENSPTAIYSILPHLAVTHIRQLELAIPALMNEEGNTESTVVSVSFTNMLTSPIQLHWIHPETEEEILASELIRPGSVDSHGSHPGHRFVAYDSDRTIRKEFQVDANYGESLHFNVEL